ncbi:MAG: hypothetical protein M3Z96_11260 [Pseudomonadota bacterium]|nr:hypothetical protein [Pseudomonadota bacterium]
MTRQQVTKPSSLRPDSTAARYGLKSFASAAMAAASQEALATLAEHLPVLDTDAALAIVEATGMKFELSMNGFKRVR